MKKHASASTATAPVMHPAAGQVFSELGYSATFFDSLPNEIVITDELGNIFASNEQFKKRFGENHPKQLSEMTKTSSEVLLAELKECLINPKKIVHLEYKDKSLTPRVYDIEVYRLAEKQKLFALIHHQNESARYEFWTRSGHPMAEPIPKDLGFLNDAAFGVIRADLTGKIIAMNHVAETLLQLESGFIRTRRLEEFGLNSITPAPEEINITRGDGSSVLLNCFSLNVSPTENIVILNDQTAAAAIPEQYARGYEFFKVFAEQSEYEIARFELKKPVSIENDDSDIISLIVDSTILTDHSSPHGEESRKFESDLTLAEFIGDHEEARLIAKAFVESGYSLLRTEFTETTKSGAQYHYYTNIIGTIEDDNLLRFWLTRRDITIRRQAEKAFAVAEDQLRQSQKVEPIGRLAGGIAHDFNNFLAVIMLQIEMIKQELPENDDLHERIGEIVKVSNRAANTVKQLLAFGRKQTMRPQNVQLNEVIQDFIRMIRPLIGEDIEMDVSLSDDLGACFVDPNQLTQILMNLAVNAKDAMPDGGVLKIKTTNLTIDENTFKHRAQPKGRYVEIEVSDDGCGMEPKTVKHVFEPFFTTKEAHKGTGLGLATVYGIVKQSKGFIWVKSEVEKGTTFKVHFPRTDREAMATKMARTKQIPRGNETILLVEDEVMIRNTSSEVLTALGYQVLTAGDGIEALEVADKHGGKINLLLSDVVMPRMNGRDLANHLKAEYPDLAILFVSGYADDIITRHGILEDDVHFLGKPFSPLSLAEQVRAALSKARD